MLLAVETFNCPSFEQNDQTWYYCRHGSWMDWNHQRGTHKKGSSKVQILGKVSGRGSDSCCIIGICLDLWCFFLWNGEEDAGIGQGKGRTRKEKEGKGRQRRDQEGTEEKRRKLTVNHQLPDANICQQSLNCDEFWTSPRSYQDRALFQLCF